MARPQIRGNQIAAGQITNSHVAAGAAIASTKLAPLSASLDAAGNRIVNVGEPVAPQDVATKAYTDAVAQGLDIKASCRLATTGSVPLLWGEMVLDSVMAYAGDRVLVKNQTGSPETNGIYQVASAGTWPRTADASGTNVSSGMFTFISSGSLLADTGWVLTTDDPIVVDVTPLTFAQFSGAGVIVAGMGMVQNGQEFDVVSANSAIRVNPNDVEVVVAGAALDIVPGGGLRVTPGEDGHVLTSNAGTVALAAVVNRVTVAEPLKIDSTGTVPGTGNVYVSLSGTSAVLTHLGLMEARSLADYSLNILGNWETNMLASWVGRGGSYSITSSPDIQVTNGSHAFTPFADIYGAVGGISTRCYVYAHAAGTVSFELTNSSSLLLLPNLDYGAWLPYVINGNKGSNWPVNTKVEFRRMDELTWNTAYDGATNTLMAGLWSGTLYQPPAPGSGYTPTLTGVRFTFTYVGTETHRIAEIGVASKHLQRHAYTAAWVGQPNEFTRGQTVDTDALTEPALTILNNGTNVAVFQTDGTTVLNSLLDLSGPNQNVGVGESALVNSTGTENVAVGYQASQNSVASNHTTALGAHALQANQGHHNTAVGAYALSTAGTVEENTAIGYLAAELATGGNHVVAVGVRALWANQGAHNTAVGHEALMANGAGYQNTAVGASALTANTGGVLNVAVGWEALKSNTLGSSEVGVGYRALAANLTGASNTAVGSQALLVSTNGDYNVAVGNGALAAATSPGMCVAVGYGAMLAATYGIDCVAVGGYALRNQSGGINNTAIGRSALESLTTGRHNTYVGVSAGKFGAVDGWENVAVGYLTRQQATAGSYNVAIGNSAQRFSQGNGNTVVGHNASSGGSAEGSYNVVVGFEAMLFNTGESNVAVGARALQNSEGDNNVAVGQGVLQNLTTGGAFTAVGYNAGFASTQGTRVTVVGCEARENGSGDWNTAVGYQAQRLSGGNYNVALGSWSQYSETGTYNTAVGHASGLGGSGDRNACFGYAAGLALGTGSDNTAAGANAFRSNQDGNFNTALGGEALYFSRTGDNQTAVGYRAMYSNLGGQDNVAVGVSAFRAAENGTRNVFVGRQAGASLTDANYSVGIGYTAGYNGTNLFACVVVGAEAHNNYTNGTYNTVIGYGADFSVAGDFSRVTLLGAQTGASVSDVNVIGYSGTNRVQDTTTIRGPLLVRRDNGEGLAQALSNYSAAEVVLFGTQTDLTSAGTQVLALPANSHFFVNEVGLHVTQFISVSVQPTVSFGNGVDTAALALPIQSEDCNVAYGRQRLTALRTYAGQTTLAAAITVAATGVLQGRPYWKGVLVED